MKESIMAASGAGGDGEERRAGMLALRRDLTLVREPALDLAEGQIVPAVMTVDLGRDRTASVPLGAYTIRGGQICFVPTVDLVGLTAVVLGIGCGWLATWKLTPVLHSLVERWSKG
jgi:hypothetical protein